MVHKMLTQIEEARGITDPITIEFLHETTLSMANVEVIATSSKGILTMYLGVEDYATNYWIRTGNIGGLNSDCPEDQRHNTLSHVFEAFRAFGLPPIDTLF